MLVIWSGRVAVVRYLLFWAGSPNASFFRRLGWMVRGARPPVGAFPARCGIVSVMCRSDDQNPVLAVKVEPWILTSSDAMVTSNFSPPARRARRSLVNPMDPPGRAPRELDVGGASPGCNLRDGLDGAGIGSKRNE